MSVDLVTRPAGGAMTRPAPGFAGTVVAKPNARSLVSAYYLILVSTGLLVAFGYLMIVSSHMHMALAEKESPWLKGLEQGGYILGGLLIGFLASRLPIKGWRGLAMPIFLIACGLQVAVVLIGQTKGGNTNWLKVAGRTIQPSEFIKFALVVWLALVLANKAAKLNRWPKMVVPVVLPVIMAGGLVLVGDDLGTGIVIGALALGSMMIAGLPWTKVGLVTAMGVVIGFVGLRSSDNRWERMTVLLHPEQCVPGGSCWQVQQASYAMAEGGIFGTGLGTSHEGWGYVAAPDSDFIFAIIGEEFGLIGCLVVILLFALLIVGLLRVVRWHPNRFAQIAVGAVACWIGTQAIINIGMVAKMLPVIGVPLPFISAGGSALVACLAAIGLVIGLMRHDPEVGPVLRARPRLLGRSGAVTGSGRDRLRAKPQRVKA